MARIGWTVLALLALVALARCAPMPAQRVMSPRVEQPPYTLFGGQYEIVEIEGMTCMVWVNGSISGITCDWSTYKGGE